MNIIILNDFYYENLFKNLSLIIKKNSLDSSITATYIEWEEHYDNDDNSNYYIDKNIQTTGKGNPTIIYYQ